MKKIEAMSEPQPPIPAEDLERIEKEAEEFAGPATEEKYPVGYLNRYEGFVAGAKAEYCHLRERIAQLEKELQEMGNSYFKQLEEKDREIARLTVNGKGLQWAYNAMVAKLKDVRKRFPLESPYQKEIDEFIEFVTSYYP